MALIEVGKPSVLKELNDDSGSLKYKNFKQMSFPASKGSNGQVLTTDGNDGISWKSVSSGGSLDQSDVYIPIEEDIITYLTRWAYLTTYQSIYGLDVYMSPAYKLEDGEYVEITIEDFGDITDYSHFETYYTKATQFASNGVPIMASGFIPGITSHTWDTSNPNDILATETITVVNPEDPSQSYDFNCMKLLTTNIPTGESLVCVSSNSQSIVGEEYFYNKPAIEKSYAETVEMFGGMPLDMFGFLPDDDETKFYVVYLGEGIYLFLGFYASSLTADSLFGNANKSGLYISIDILNMTIGGDLQGLTLVLRTGTADVHYKSPSSVVEFSPNRPYIIDIARGHTSGNKFYFYISNSDYNINFVRVLLKTGIPVMLSVDSKILYEFEIFGSVGSGYLQKYTDEDNGKILLTCASGLNLTSSSELKFTAILSPKVDTTPDTYKSIGTAMTQYDYDTVTRYSPLYIYNGSSYEVATEYVSGTEYFQKLKATIDNTMCVLGAEINEDGAIYFSANFFDTRYTYPINP